MMTVLFLSNMCVLVSFPYLIVLAMTSSKSWNRNGESGCRYFPCSERGSSQSVSIECNVHRNFLGTKLRMSSFSISSLRVLS